MLEILEKCSIMVLDGIKWNKMDFFGMIAFCGYDRCSVDSAGRLKLSPAVLADFGGAGAGLVMRCLPEGCIAVYPEAYFQKMRQAGSENSAELTASSALFRRNLRMLNAMSAPVSISPQGRITLPGDFRKRAGIDQTPDVVVVGVEVGVEIWSLQRWNEEQARIDEHMELRDELEMKKDLDNLNRTE